MKISRIAIAIVTVSTFLMTSCNDSELKSETTEEHGHEHDENGNHINEETIGQEEFVVDMDSIETTHQHHKGDTHSSSGDSKTHKHDDGSEHKDHK
jgi:hypothetical protein